MDDGAGERAKRRRDWPGVVVTTTSPAQLPTARERLASMEQLALDAFTASGRTLPSYDRATMPGHVRPLR